MQYLAEFAELPRYVQARAVQILRMHVMGNVRQRIEAGHRDFVNEIRVCTCLFLGFPSLKVSAGCCGSLQMLCWACVCGVSEGDAARCCSCLNKDLLELEIFKDIRARIAKAAFCGVCEDTARILSLQKLYLWTATAKEVNWE